MKNRLFLVCPHCYTEDAVREHFDGDLYFITALGASFSNWEHEYESMIKNLCSIKNINEIYIINEVSCCFINNDAKFDDLTAELISGSRALEKTIKVPKRTNMEAARINIKKQISHLMDIFRFDYNTGKESLKLGAFIFLREENKFIPYAIDY